MLSIKLQNSEELKGISINPVNIKLTLVVKYAEALSVFVKNETELETALKIIENFGMLCGLKLNRHKSIILTFGGYQRSSTYSQDVKWLKPDEYVKVLGIYFSGETEASILS